MSIPASPAVPVVSSAPEMALSSPLLTVSGALFLVLLVFAGIVWFLRRSGMVHGVVKGQRFMSVLHSQTLGPRERVVLVEIDDRRLLLGVTQETITCLATLDKKTEGTEVESAPLAGNFQVALLSSLKKRPAGERK